MTFKLGKQHWVLEYYQVCSNDAPGLTLPYFTTRSNLVPYAFVWENFKTMDFFETIIVYDTKVGRWVHETLSTKGQDHSFTLFQITQIKYFQTYFPQRPLTLTYLQHSGEQYRTIEHLVFLQSVLSHVPGKTLAEKLNNAWVRLQTQVNCIFDSELDKLSKDVNPGIKQVM